MKKIAANLALTGSLLITAAVLAPLLQDQGQSLGLWIDQVGPANLAGRADLSTGLAS